MRIVIDGRYINDRFPGIGRYTHNLIHALSKMRTGDDYFILTNPHLENSRFDTRPPAWNPKFRHIHCRVPRRFPWEAVMLPRIICRLDPDVFHSPFFLRPYFLACPCVVTLHDLIPLKHPHPGPEAGFQRLVFRTGATLACKFSHAVISPSRASSTDIRRVFGDLQHRLVTIPIPPDPAFEPANRAKVEKMRRKYSLSGPYVLHVGTHLRHKNLRGLVSAWGRISAAPPEQKTPHRLVLAGHGISRAEPTMRSIRACGVSHLVQIIEDVDENDLPSLYSGADLFVFPSYIEGVGLPVLEAMACGTPVICSDTESLRETSGGAACLTAPDNPALLAAAIKKFLLSPDLRADHVKKGFERVRRLAWSDTAASTRQVYQMAAGDKKGGRAL